MKKGGILMVSLLLVTVLLTVGMFGCVNDNSVDNQSPETSLTVPSIKETTNNTNFQEDFGFRGKRVSLEETENLIGARLPLPTHLPEGYAVQEIYIGVGNSTTIILISDGPIEKVNREPPDEPKDYPIHLVKCEMSMYVSFETDLSVIGGNKRPTPSEMVFDEGVDSNCVWWTVQVDDKTASLYLVARKDLADKDEIIKIAESVSG